MSKDEDTNFSARVEPLSGERLDSVQDVLQASKARSGYVPTSMRIMARKPEILRRFADLRDAVMQAPGEVSTELKWLAVHAASTSAGCLYCQAHTAANGNKGGIEAAKLEALLEFETSERFSEMERAVIAFGLAVGQVPNAAQSSHFHALREHFSDDGIVELVAALSLFGWLNRWNDTFASDLEDAPREFAEKVLGDRGWSIGKHAGAE